MIKTNWHTHTSRCGHAVGTDEEYVQAAIQAGITTLGFSDHAAYREPYPTERMDITEVPDYTNSILSLKEKYKDQIDIYLGMEVECYKDQWDTLARYRREMDYCILGQHNLSIHGRSSYDLTNRKQLEKYTDLLEYACEHALCDYIAHPDVCMWSYPRIDGSVREIAARMADISVKYNMPMELNAGSGVRRGEVRYADGYRYPYPVRVFFEEFAKKKCPVVIGLDVHDPRIFLTDVYIERVLSVVEGLDCNILEDFDIIEAAKKRKPLFY